MSPSILDLTINPNLVQLKIRFSIEAMLAEIAKDMLEIKSHRVSIDYGGTLFDANGTVNQSVKERLFLQTSQNVTVLAVFLDALIPREQQLTFLKPIERGKKGKNQEKAKEQNQQQEEKCIVKN